MVGIGCRLPGEVNSPAGFWDLLAAGRETTGPAPEERWQWYRDLSPEHDSALQRVVGSGSFLSDIGAFDAEFFGLSPREAELMDPQQRILLETAWEALEHAGLPPRDLAGSDTGVYVGVCTGDYGRRLLEDLPSIDAWSGIGAATCALANRISYALDLRGPSLVTDTACSASLVALHLACQSLRAGESTVAIAAGVNLIVSPGETLSLDAAGALSPDGRCKPFDAAADGYGRSEGCGVLVLKRLPDAQRDGDRILALVRGSAVNQDGRTNGIMAPSGPAQEHVMRRACEQAAVDPATVDYVEAHGTGTRLGDPLEAAALSAVYGAGRAADEPCLLGSVKSNIGHLEGAAGVAGVIKAVLALDKAEIPASLLSRLNPDIEWVHNGMRVATERTSWPERAHPRRATVSGFGYGGTVAHILLEQAPVTEPVRPGPDDAHRLFPLSAGSPTALHRYAGRLADWLGGAGAQAPLGSVGHTLAHRRSPLAHRAVVAAAGGDDLRAKLRHLADGGPTEGLVTGAHFPGEGPGPVWVFSGHGSQWPGMGRELLKSEPAFAAVIDELTPVFTEEIGFSPRQALVDGDFDGVDRIQTMIFAMQVGLAAVWRSYGGAPSAVIGHSVGEIAAAVSCGALSLPDGARLICRRSLLLRRVAGKGAMAMVGMPFAEVERRLADRADIVAAISSSPHSTVVSGDPAAVREVAGEWEGAGLMVRQVASDVAFHSPQMDQLLTELAAAAADLTPHPPDVPMYRTAVADPRSARSLDGTYWAENLRAPVRLTSAVAAAVEDGHRAFLEISPHPVVAHSINECLTDQDEAEVFVGWTLRRDRPEDETLLEAIAAAHCNGLAVDWSRLQPAGDLVALPTRTWEHRSHWREPESRTPGMARRHDVRSHTLLGSPTAIAGTELRVWHTSLDDANRPYPGSHALNETEIVPAAVFVATFMDARPAESDTALTEVTMSRPLMTAELRDVQVVRDGEQLRLASRAADDDGDWTIHATATVPAAVSSPALGGPLAVGRSWQTLDPGFVQQRLASVGVPETGFDWTVEELRSGGAGILRAGVRLKGPVRTWAPALDAVMSVAPCAFPGQAALRMIVHADQIAVTGEPPETVVIDAVVDESDEDTVHIRLADAEDRVVAELIGLRYPVIGRLGDDDSGTSTEIAEAAAEAWYAELPPEQLRERVLEEVGAQIEAEMKLPAGQLNPRRPLLDQGLDSVLTVAVRRRLGKRFGYELPATLIWQQPTVAAIADHLTKLITG
ncbi:MAG: acyltransferase domain-containing protein [Actinophytocola sp.]|nr:acyltransferase domain-containing protein [Actinophytocola sp.]